MLACTATHHALLVPTWAARADQAGLSCQPVGVLLTVTFLDEPEQRQRCDPTRHGEPHQ